MRTAGTAAQAQFEAMFDHAPRITTELPTELPTERARLIMIAQAAARQASTS